MSNWSRLIEIKKKYVGTYVAIRAESALRAMNTASGIRVKDEVNILIATVDIIETLPKQ